MAFLYERTIRFRDTDAAGVVYFANVLAMCHEAYEAALMAAGIDLKHFFSDRTRALPIVHAEVDFFQPMVCGDRYTIALAAALLKPSEFALAYAIYDPALGPDEQEAIAKMLNAIAAGDAPSPTRSRLHAKALTRHVCIHPQKRQRLDLNPTLLHWIATL